MDIHLSFDVGFRNMAWCAVAWSQGDPACTVIGWDMFDMGADYKKLPNMKKCQRLMKSMDDVIDGTLGEHWSSAKSIKIYIEQQPSKNPTMKYLEHLLGYYFSMRGLYHAEPINVVSVSSRVKLGHDVKKRTYAERKSASVSRVYDICDAELCAIFTEKKKKDDMSDALMYLANITGCHKMVILKK